MYKRHNVWDEDKWNIHGSGSGSGYAGHSGSSDQQYHKGDMYSAGKDENKMADTYRAAEQKDEEKDKDKEAKEKSIVDTVENEEKKQKGEEGHDDQDTFTFIKKDSGNEGLAPAENKAEKKKEHKSIEEAIDKAIKEEKDVVFAH